MEPQSLLTRYPAAHKIEFLSRAVWFSFWISVGGNHSSAFLHEADVCLVFVAGVESRDLEGLRGLIGVNQ
jgi:hypothetical protein